MIKHNNKTNIYEYKNIEYKIKSNPEIEIKRKELLEEFLDDYIKQIKKYIHIENKNINSEKQIIIFISYIHNKNKNDPILLDNISIDIIKSVLDFNNVKLDNKKLNDLVLNINNKCKNVLDKLSDFKYENEDDVYCYKKDDNIQIKYKNIEYTIPYKLYDRIKSKRLTKNNFNNLLFCILTRYKATYNYNTMHLAVPPDIYQLFKKEYNTNLELFGSVMNRTMDNYCGLFYDIEKNFGSRGNFFNINIKKGVYVCNPPYEIYLIELAYKKILDSLANSKEKITIFNVLPAWNAKYQKIIEKKCKNTKFKNFDKNNVYLNFLESKFLIYHKLYCKSEFAFYNYLNNEYINATHCHIFILSNDKKFNIKPLDNLLKKYKSLI